MSERRSPGKLPAQAIGMLTLPALPDGVVEGFSALPDLTGMASDAMDEIGIAGAIPASMLRPTMAAARLVGRALTVHNVPRAMSVAEAVATGVSTLGEIEAHHLAEPGDVLVIQGVDLVSNLGGMSATIGHRQGQIGAVVDGGVRDVDQSRTIGYPIWSRSVSPITGKWRVETVAVNRPVTVCGVRVAPGDLVLADEVGVCFIPRERALEALERTRRIAANEEARRAKITAGVAVADLMPKPRR
jgi:4-hydroxy-4-methyl-2-oxoglutarate aldolase